MPNSPEIKIFAGTAHRQLAENICAYLGVPLGDASVSSFPDGETFVKINENIRGRDVYIVQPTCPPTNQNLMELLILVDAARRASAYRITAVIPFFGYARQDRKDQPRVCSACSPWISTRSSCRAFSTFRSTIFTRYQ
jgi:ribose-phosphate pyrophosphokinase